MNIPKNNFDRCGTKNPTNVLNIHRIWGMMLKKRLRELFEMIIKIIIYLIVAFFSLAFLGLIFTKIDEFKANKVEKPPENETDEDKEKRINTAERRIRVVKDKEYICRKYKDTFHLNTEYYCPFFGGRFMNGKVKHYKTLHVKEGLYVACGDERYNHNSLTLSGIQTSDIITKINGRKVIDAIDIFNLYPEVGNSYEFEFMREEKTYKTTVFVFDNDEAQKLAQHIGRDTLHEINQYRNSDYSIGLDTNILLKFPNVIETLSHIFPFFISKQVFSELDKQKTNEDIGHLSRNALKLIEELQLRGANIETAHVDASFLDRQKLNPQSPDEKIIGSYLQEKNKGKNILFISEDRGARVIARQHGLRVIDFGNDGNKIVPKIQEVIG